MAAPLKVRAFVSKICPAKVSSNWSRCSSHLSQEKPPKNSNEEKLPQSYNEEKLPQSYNEEKLPQSYNEEKLPENIDVKKSLQAFNWPQPTKWLGTRWENTKIWWTTDPLESEECLKDEQYPDYVSHNSDRDFYEMIKLKEGHMAPFVKGPLDGKYKCDPEHYPLLWRKLQGMDFEIDDMDLFNMRMRHSNSHYLREKHVTQLKANRGMNNELVAANFFCYNGGKVKFLDRPFWIKKDEKGMFSLPPAAAKELSVEAIDARKINLTSVVFDYLDDLESLRYLNISDNDDIDDACLARLQRVCPNLEYLDVSNCNGITDNGITALYNLKSLQVLQMDNLPLVQHRGYVAMLMEETIPGLQVLGITEEDCEPPKELTPIGESKRVSALLGQFPYEKYAHPSEGEVIPDGKDEWEIEELTYIPEFWLDKKLPRRLIKVDWANQEWCGNPANTQTSSMTKY